MQITFVCKSVQFHVQTMYVNPFSCVCKSFTLYMQITYVYKSLQLYMQITSVAYANHSIKTLVYIDEAEISWVTLVCDMKE